MWDSYWMALLNSSFWRLLLNLYSWNILLFWFWWVGNTMLTMMDKGYVYDRVEYGSQFIVYNLSYLEQRWSVNAVGRGGTTRCRWSLSEHLESSTLLTTHGSDPDRVRCKVRMALLIYMRCESRLYCITWDLRLGVTFKTREDTFFRKLEYI